VDSEGHHLNGMSMKEEGGRVGGGGGGLERKVGERSIRKQDVNGMSSNDIPRSRKVRGYIAQSHGK